MIQEVGLTVEIVALDHPTFCVDAKGGPTRPAASRSGAGLVPVRMQTA